MTKYTFTKGPVTPDPRPFDLEQQMRQFMVEKRSAGQTHSHQQAPLTPPHYNTHKQLPVPPSPSPPPSRKLLRLTSKSKRFVSPAAKRAGPEIRPVPPHPGRIRNHHPSASAPSLVSPGEMRQLQQRRPSSFIAPETPNDIFWPGIGSPGIYPKRPWRSPENSPLLPPPRGTTTTTTGRTIPPPIKISPSSSSPTPRKVTPVQLRNKTSEMFESVLSMYPHSKKQPPAARSNPDIAVLPNSSGITPRRITIDSVESTPRTPPPPPTPAKSRAQRERARPTQPPPTPAPSGYAAELVGSAVAPVEIGPVELMGDIEFPAPVIMAPVPQKRRRVKASAINSRVRQRPQAAPKPGTPEGREIYALMPLPEVPDTPVSIKPVSKSSPVLDVDFEGFNDGLVEWFNNFNWSESGDLLINTTTTTTAPAPEPTFNVGTRASVVDPDGAVVNPEPPAKPTMLSPKLPAETALLSPVYPVSPRLASYYGARASFASSVGDAFRFDGDEGCALSDVDEELDVDELYQEQFLDEGHGHGHGDLELEIEMILNGGGYDWRDGIYSAGSTSGSSVDVEEVIADYWMEEEEEEGDILVGMVRGEAGEEEEEEGGLDWAALQGMWADDELHEAGHRPRTRYIAGRNSAIEGDVVFCLKSAERI